MNPYMRKPIISERQEGESTRSLDNVTYIFNLPKGKEKDSLMSEILNIANQKCELTENGYIGVYLAMEIVLNERGIVR